MIKAVIRHRDFIFRRAATTSRGTLHSKSVHFIVLYDDANPFVSGIGECSVFPGLSMDDVENFSTKLEEVAQMINKGWFNLNAPLYGFPSINFALETAFRDLENKGTRILYPSKFTSGEDFIPINGLIWMGNLEDMVKQINQKLNEGFTCLKMKIGALDFNEEYLILSAIRKEYKEEELEIRLDANGAFQPDDALELLYRLSDLGIHSIEQPILPSQLEEMAALCETTPVPIALDEELIGKYPVENKRQLLKLINPQYIVLKPGLLGGIKSCEEWIKVAGEQETGWWITSSLETNIGLNAIAQWTYTLNSSMPQGLSTGGLFVNNIDSPLALAGEKLYYFPRKKWDLSLFTSK
ncbi:MAG: o-succinylbenzoate synthase [Bacteroidales bacterium]|nr:o-succinylbenzoate synthase [Bacteroidales bacterium]